jgi:uncharacterized protein YbaP (TraB family)
MNATRRRLLSAGLVAVVAPSLTWPATAWTAPRDTYPLWEIRRGSAKVYLFGDCGAATDPWSSQRIEAAFDESAVFWKETPDGRPDDGAKFVAAGVDRARPLSTWLTPQQKDRVAAAAVAAGASYGALEPLKPWLAAIVLSNAYERRKASQKTAPTPGAAPGSDPLSVLTARAKTAGKPMLTEFADTAAVIGWMAGMSPAQQVEYLLFKVEDNEADPALAAQRTKSWGAGDLGPETREVLRIQRAHPDLAAPLFVERNRAWPARFRKMLDDGGTSFVLVGCDHLLGPDSVLAQLAHAGMPPKRI